MNEMSPLPLTREAFEASMADYRAAGVARADAIGNRGPLVLDANGKLHPDIWPPIGSTATIFLKTLLMPGKSMHSAMTPR